MEKNQRKKSKEKYSIGTKIHGKIPLEKIPRKKFHGKYSMEKFHGIISRKKMHGNNPTDKKFHEKNPWKKFHCKTNFHGINSIEICFLKVNELDLRLAFMSCQFSA